MKEIIKKGREYFKKVGINNPIDVFFDKTRDLLNEFGVLDIYDDFIYWNGWRNFRLLFKYFFGYDIKGKGNLSEYGPVLVVSNHQSEFDPFLVGSSMQRKVSWLSKKENFEIPIFRSIIKPFGTIPIQRGKSDKEALLRIDAILNSGACVGMFPEGTRSEDGDIGDFRKGAALICMKNNVPYIPVAIIGAHKALPKGTTLFKAKKSDISIRIGKPVFIDPSIQINIDNLEIIKNDMQRRIKALYDGISDNYEESTRIVKIKDDWVGLYSEEEETESYEEYGLSIG